jgi:hypothetical protein
MKNMSDSRESAWSGEARAAQQSRMKTTICLPIILTRATRGRAHNSAALKRFHFYPRDAFK